MKQILLASVILISSTAFADPTDWFIVKVVDQTNPQGFGTYVAKVKTADIEEISKSDSKLNLVHLSNMIVIDQSGQIKKPSDIPWGNKYVTGNEVFVRSSAILEIMTVNTKLKPELDSAYK